MDSECVNKTIAETKCTTTAAHWTLQIVTEEMSYILLISSGLQFTGMLLKIQQEIVYTLAFKAMQTAAIRTFLKR